MRGLGPLFKTSLRIYLRDGNSVFWGLAFPIFVLTGVALVLGHANEHYFRVGLDPTLLEQETVAAGVERLRETPLFELTIAPMREEVERLKRGERHCLVEPAGDPPKRRPPAPSARKAPIGPKPSAASSNDPPLAAERSADSVIRPSPPLPEALPPLRYRFIEGDAKGLACIHSVDTLLRMESEGRKTPWEIVPLRSTRARYVAFLFPGLVGMGIMNGPFYGVGFNIVQYRATGILRRLHVTPMRLATLFASQFLVRAFVALSQTVLIFAYCRLVFALPFAERFLLLLGFVVLGTATFISLTFAVTCRSKSVESIAGPLNLIGFALLFLGGVFFDVAWLPPWIASFSAFLPLTALTDALRGLVLGGIASGRLLFDALVLLGWSGLSLWVAIRLFRWD
ncbi:MAG: ABC transporter permease [Deltaproteobacteria bacterium]|nr:MAG: ABC transporter permease [Deltaproteobacteria bacterium]